MPGISWLAKRPIAHRGYHDLNRTRWENTLSAFEAARAQYDDEVPAGQRRRDA